MAFTPRTAIEKAQEREDRARTIFHEFDKNSDGVIDFEELKEMLRSLDLGNDGTDEGAEREKKLLQEWRKMDVDGDGGVTFPEFVHYYNNLLSYMSGETHSHDEHGSGVLFWSEKDIVKYMELAKKLIRRKKLKDSEDRRTLKGGQPKGCPPVKDKILGGRG